MKKLLLFLLVSISSLNAFSLEKGYVIVGHIEGIPDNALIFLRNLETEEILDTVRVIGNRFEMEITGTGWQKVKFNLMDKLKTTG